MKKISLAVAACSALTLAACGGGTDDGNVPSSGGPVTLYGQVEMCEGASNSGARVVLPYGQDQTYETTTAEDGSFEMTVDSSNFDGVSPVALAVFDESSNCAPAEVFVGDTVATAEGRRIDLLITKLKKLLPAHFALSTPARPLIHLGDDRFGGQANSRLQVASHGTSVSNLVGTITSDFKAQYNKAYIEFSARGMQQESLQCATHYENRIALTATPEGGGETIVKEVRPDPSNANGEFTRYSIPVDLTDIPAGSTIHLVATSGQCASGGTDYDDFELSNVVVRFGT